MTVPSYCRGLPMGAIRTKMALASSRIVNVVVLGNSIAQGYAAGGPSGTLSDRLLKSWVAILRNNLQNVYTGSGNGLFPLSWNITDPWSGSVGVWEILGSNSDPATNEFAPFGYCKSFISSGVTLHGVNCDRVDVLTLEYSDSTAWELYDGSTTHGPYGTSNASYRYQLQTVTFGSTATRNLTFRPQGSSGKSYLCGISPRVGTTGVVVHNCSLSGGRVSDPGFGLSNRGAATTDNLFGWLSVLVPDVMIVPLSSNDYATQLDQSVYSARLDALVSYAQSLGSVVLLIHDPPRDAGAVANSLASYGELMEDIATARGCGFINCQEMWVDSSTMIANGYSTSGDPVHPTNLGHVALANTVLQYAGWF